MTAPLFLLPEGALATAGPGERVVLEGPEGRHAATVTRLQVGQQVLVADGSGAVAETEVLATGTHRLDLQVRRVHQHPVPDPRFVLVQALAKGHRDEQAIETATELGVDEVVPWQASRSIVVWRPERTAKALRKWQDVVRAAAKQSRRPRVPTVSPPAGRQDVIRRIGSATRALVLHEDATTPLAGTDLPQTGEVLLIVGPEGGISPEELDAFTAAGAQPVRLGATVLRSASAGPAALAVLNARSRWR